MERIGAQRRKTAEGSPPGERERVNLQERIWLLFDIAHVFSTTLKHKQIILCALCALCGQFCWIRFYLFNSVNGRRAHPIGGLSAVFLRFH
jgi:hypothetical protein